MASFTRLAQTALQAQQLAQSVGANPIEKDAQTGGPTVQGEESDAVVQGSKIGILACVALAALGAGGASFYLISSALVDFSSVLTMAFAPVVLYQKRKLAKLKTFRDHHNNLRLAIGNARYENERMNRTLHKLDTQTKKLDTVQQRLEAAAAKSGAQVDRLLKICRENADIQMKLREQLQADVVRQIMTVLLSVDSDRNFVLSSDELDRLVQRLNRMPVEFHEANFRRLISREPYGGSLCITDVCNIVRAFNTDLVDEDEAIFTFKKVETSRS